MVDDYLELDIDNTLSMGLSMGLSINGFINGFIKNTHG